MFSALSQTQPSDRIEQEVGLEVQEFGDRDRAEQLNALWREALTMWLCWSEGQDQLTAQMFEAREDSRQLADLMDQMEQLRWRAMEMTRELLDSPLTALDSHTRGPGAKAAHGPEQDTGSLFERRP